MDNNLKFFNFPKNATERKFITGLGRQIVDPCYQLLASPCQASSWYIENKWKRANRLACFSVTWPLSGLKRFFYQWFLPLILLEHQSRRYISPMFFMQRICSTTRHKDWTTSTIQCSPAPSRTKLRMPNPPLQSEYLQGGVPGSPNSSSKFKVIMWPTALFVTLWFKFILLIGLVINLIAWILL